MRKWFGLVCLVLGLTVVAYGWKYEKELAKYLKANPQTTPEMATAMQNQKLLRGMNWNEAIIVVCGLADLDFDSNEKEIRRFYKHVKVDDNGVEIITGIIKHNAGGYYIGNTWIARETDRIWVTLWFDDKGLLWKWEIDGDYMGV